MRSLFPVAVAALVLFALPGVFVFAADLLGYGPDLNAWLEARLGLSHRLALSIPAALVLFCVPLAIILLHLLRLRRRPVVVSSTLLWRASAEDLHANALLRWLRRNVLLLLQLLAAFLLVYAVLGPRLHAAAGTGRHYVLVIDNSASMSATDVPPSRLEWAKAEALKEIDAATDEDFGMVVVFNRTAETRQGYTSDRELLRAAVRGIQPSAAQTRLDEALRLCAGLANPARSTENEATRPANTAAGKERTYVAPEGVAAEVHLYSDGAFPPVPDFALANLTLNYHVPPLPQNLDGSADNVAITRLDAARDGDRLTVTATVRNYRTAPLEQLTARLDVLDGGRATRSYARPVRLATRASGEVEFTLPDPGGMPLRVTLENTGDALALDDVAWAVAAPTRRARVAALGPPNPVLDAFLDSPGTRRLAEVTRLGEGGPADRAKYLDPAREGRFDLVIFDRCAPAVAADAPRANTLYLGSRPPGLTADPTPVKNPRVVGWAGSHPVTRGLRGLYDVPIAEAARLTNLPPRTERLIESDGNVVLLAGVPRPPFTDLVLAFPVVEDGKWNTLWPLEPSFVLFLRNVVRAYGNLRDGTGEEVLRPGDAITLRTGGARRVTVTTPGGHTETLDPGDRGEVTFSATGEVGVYVAAIGDDRVQFAVNLFDPDESDIAPRGTVTVGNQTVAAGEVRRPPRELWKWAVLAALVVLLAEWWAYAARVR
jgi:von Willebrand factor type A domain/Aerotolerance regulator N-terminal